MELLFQLKWFLRKPMNLLKVCTFLGVFFLLGCNLRPSDPLALEDNTKQVLPNEADTVPIQPTFESINTHVFLKTCKNCHTPEGKGKRVLLDLESLLNSQLQLIIPMNPDESGLVVAIERKDDERMPPAENGYAELSIETKLAIRKWIENGAKD